MIQGLDSSLDFAYSIIYVYILLLILPYILGFFLNWMYSVLAFIFRFGYNQRYSSINRSRRTATIGRFVSFIFLPGTLLRVMFVFLFLKLRGWELSISYPGFVGSMNRSLSDKRRTGFFIAMRPNNKRRISFKEIVQVSLVGYIPLFIAYFMWKTRADQIDFLIYLHQGNLSIFWIYFLYYYLLLAILIGGAPIPEETMLPIYFIIARYPHLFIGIIGSYIVGFWISMMEIGYLGFEGSRLGYTYFITFSTILFFKIVINERQLNITKNKIDEVLLEMELLELV